MTCIKCNTTIEIYCNSTGEEITTAGALATEGSKDAGDEFICENCIVKDYMHHRTRCMIMGIKFKMIPELEELIAERYTSVKSLRHRYN